MAGLHDQENRNRSRLRGLNEARELAHAPAFEGKVSFACECGDTSCTKAVRLTHSEYEDVRSLANRFLVARNHENPETEAVVWEDERWAIVEVVGREAVMAARRSDPRRL